VKVGEYDAITGTLDLTRGQPLVWRGKSPPKDRTLHIIEHSTVNITIYAVLASAASLGIVMAAVFLAINIKYRNQRYRMEPIDFITYAYAREVQTVIGILEANELDAVASRSLYEVLRLQTTLMDD
jgi:hypothetical protein